ncbi:MAG: AAA family ATPase, partial [Spirochaetia bacterium]|nr:AAA family ATPase [Spirochaetia bacterium]
MFDRFIQQNLQAWLEKPKRKPLMLRGARQTGKTTAVKMFSRQFSQFLFFNMEIKEDRDIFEQDLVFEKLVEAMFFIKNMDRNNPSTLIFIDEIQNSSKAISLLRYFYEYRPDLPVISAGSLLEAVIDLYNFSLPAGRVEFMYLFPVTFEEYLAASSDNTSALDAFNTIPVPEYAHGKLLSLFHEYVMIGGMPEIIDTYLSNRNMIQLAPIYESLMTSYIDDAGKYSSNQTMYNIIRHAIES